MPADSTRADAHILDLCADLGRWLDDPAARPSARRRLGEAMGERTLNLLSTGLRPAPFTLRTGRQAGFSR
jgi:hypothetical protein